MENYVETSFYQKETVSLDQLQEKLGASGNSKRRFSSRYFIVGDNHRNIISLHKVIFSKNAILYFSYNFYLLKYFPIKVPENCFDSLNCTNKISMQISETFFAPIYAKKQKNKKN